MNDRARVAESASTPAQHDGELSRAFEGIIDAIRREGARTGWQEPAPPTTFEIDGCDAGELAMFLHPLEADYVGFASFAWERTTDDGGLVARAALGVIYEPARKLLAALTGSDVLGVALRAPAVEVGVDVARPDRAAEQLASVFSAHTLETLGSLADVAPLAELLRSGRGVAFAGVSLDIEEGDAVHLQHRNGQLLPALYAAAHRAEEARSALSEYASSASDGGWSPREFRRFARQLTRFLAFDTNVALPDSPARWPSPAMGEADQQTPPGALGELQARATAWRKSIQAVRQAEHAMTEQQMRELLARELEQRGVKLHPSSVETLSSALALAQRPRGTAIAGRRLIAAARRRLRSSHTVKAQNERSSGRGQARGEPSISLPERAAYPILGFPDAPVAEWATIELSPGASELLSGMTERTSQEPLETSLPRRIEVWFKPTVEPSAAPGSLDVYLGETSIGQLPPPTATFLAPAINAAAERDEDPWTHAFMTSTGGGHVVEIPLSRGIVPSVGGRAGDVAGG